MTHSYPLTWQSILAAALVLGAGTLHFVYAPIHIGASRGQGFFFLVLGFAQAGWGAYALQNPTPRSYPVGLAFMAVMPAALYGVTRFVAAPFSDRAEGIDVLGGSTFLAEGAAALLLTWHAVRQGIQWQRPTLSPLLLATVLIVLGLVAAAAALGVGAGLEELVPWLNQGETTGHSAGGHTH